MEEKKLPITTAVVWVKTHTQELLGTKEVIGLEGKTELIRAFEWENEPRGSELMSSATTDLAEAKALLERIQKPLDQVDYPVNTFYLKISSKQNHLRVVVNLEAFYKAYYLNQIRRFQLIANFLNDIYDPSGKRDWKVLVDTSQKQYCFYLAYYTENLELSAEDFHNALNKETFSFSIRIFPSFIKLQVPSRKKDIQTSAKKETQEPLEQKNITETEKRRYIIEDKIFLASLLAMAMQYFPSPWVKTQEKSDSNRFADQNDNNLQPQNGESTITSRPLGSAYGNASPANTSTMPSTSTYFSTQVLLESSPSKTNYGNAPKSSAYFSTAGNELASNSRVSEKNKTDKNKDEFKSEIRDLRDIFKEHFSFSTGTWKKHSCYLEFEISKNTSMERAQHEIAVFRKTVIEKMSPVMAQEFTSYLEEKSGNIRINDKQFLHSLYLALKNHPKESKAVSNENPPNTKKVTQEKPKLLSTLWSTKKEKTEKKDMKTNSNHSAEHFKPQTPPKLKPQEAPKNSTPYQSFQ